MVRHELNKEELKKLGAKFIDIQGVMFYVKFRINNYKISYLYHLNSDNTYFLERIKPYTMAVGNYSTEEEIVDLIKVDIEQFSNAMKSKHFKNFLDIDMNISKLVRIFEDLYLYYNLDDDDIDKINGELDQLLEIFLQIKFKSERVYLKKEPDVLKDNLQLQK
jgi:flagellin-specific chaperone FliS